MLHYFGVSSSLIKTTIYVKVLQERSNFGTVYGGLELFKAGKRLQSALDAPGVAEGTAIYIYIES